MNTTRPSATVLAFAAATAAAVATLTFAATSTASTPTSVSEAFHRSIPNFISCPASRYEASSTSSRTVTTFYDSEARPSARSRTSTSPAR